VTRTKPEARRAPNKTAKQAQSFPHLNLRSNVAQSDGYEVTSLDSYIARSFGAAAVPTLFSIAPKTAGKREPDVPFIDNWTVFACLRALEQGVAGVRLRVWESADPKAREVGEDHPLVKLLRKPNRSQSWSQLAAAGIVHRRLTGEDFWFLMDAAGKPAAPMIEGQSPTTLVPPVPFDYPSQIVSVSGGATVSDQRDNLGRVATWQYGSAKGSSAIFPRHSVVHFKDYNPADPERGLGAVAVADRQIRIAFQAERYMDSMLRGGGPGAFAIREDPIDPKEHARQQRELNSMSRDPEAPGQTKLLQGKWTITANPASTKNLGVFDQLRWSRDVIATLLQVPLPVINVLENATYANGQESWRQFFLGIAAYLVGVADVINSQFLPNLKDPQAQKFRVSFAIDEIESLKKDNVERYKAAAEMSRPPSTISFEEACEILDLPIRPTKFGKHVLVSSTLVPIEYLLEDPAGASGAVDPSKDAAVAALPGGTAVQDQAMNGAQTASLLEILGAVSEGKLTPDGAVAVIVVAFPAISEEEARRMVDGVNEKPPEPTPTPADPKVDPKKDFDATERAALFGHLEPLGEAARKEYARSFEQRILRKGDRAIYAGAKKWFAQIQRATLARWQAFANEAGKSLAGATKSTETEIELLLIERRTKWEQLLADYTGPAIDQVYELSLNDAADEFGGISIPMTDVRVQEALRTQKLALSEGVTSTVSNRVKKVILDVLGDPATIGDLQLAVREYLPELTDELNRVFGTKEARALTIARTESGHAASSAKFLQYGEMGAERLQWVTAHDDHVRDSHRELDGTVVSYNAEFASGLRYPRDSNGPADEVINCRCTFIGLFPEEEP
jgi:SPP1 gp7 family putative phage head morphogenesis protein